MVLQIGVTGWASVLLHVSSSQRGKMECHGKPQRRLAALFVRTAQPTSAVVVLGEDIALVVVGGPGAAAAAALRVVARAA